MPSKPTSSKNTPEQNQLLIIKELQISGDSFVLLRSLTEDVLNLEANVGKSLWEMGKKLSSIRTLLKEKGVAGSWEKWCEYFAYSKDYANRMIQVAEIFKDADSVPSSLTFRHFREVARFNFKSSSEEEVAKLAKVVAAAGLNTKDTRQLISAANAGKIDLDLNSITESSPKLRKELDETLKKAREMGANESAKRLEELQKRVEKMDQDAQALAQELDLKASKVKELTGQVRLNDAAVKIGDGDPEIGKLKIQLERAIQAKESVEMALKEVSRDATHARMALDRFQNSPAGQAKTDVRKSFEDLQKFFKDSMTPAFLTLKVHKVSSEETKEAIISLVEGIEDWCNLVRQQLNQPTKLSGS